MIVVDTSIAIKWLVREEGSDAAEVLIGREMIAPDLLLAEAANALWKKTRRGEIERAHHALALGAIESFVVLFSFRELVTRALEIGTDLEHPIYDCFYLALAERLDVPLLTADKRFAGSVARSAIRTRILTLEDVV